MKNITHHEVFARAAKVVQGIDKAECGFRAYPIPRGGVPAAYAIMRHDPFIELVPTPEEADFFIDDIIASGTTRDYWTGRHPNKAFFALVDNTATPDEWVVFPWESDEKSHDDTIVGTLLNRLRLAGAAFHANDNIARFIAEEELAQLREEVERRVEHLLRGLLIDVDNDHNTTGTAHRVAKMYLDEVFRGRYTGAPRITDFPNVKQLDEMYMTGPITVRSTCSHHFVPIIGQCWIGIVPGDRVMGLSKFNRIVEWIAARPQIQEELVVQVANFLESQLKPKGIAVVIEASHMCMTLRGVKEPMAAKMTTNVMRGVFRDNPETRAEFMTLVAKG